MTDIKQLAEVCDLLTEIADIAAEAQQVERLAAERAALEAYLRTIGEPENTFPLNPNGASKWARLQKHDGAEAIGVVFRTSSGSVGSLVDGRVVWADWLAHPNGSKPEGVNAELLEALKECMKWQAEGEFGDPLSEEYWSPAYKEFMGKTKEAIARAESAIIKTMRLRKRAGRLSKRKAEIEI